MEREHVWVFGGESSAAVGFHTGVLKNLLREHNLNDVIEMHFEGGNIILAISLLTNWMRWLTARDDISAFDNTADALLVDAVAYFLTRPRTEWADALELLDFHEDKGIALPECVEFWIYPPTGTEGDRERWDVIELLAAGLSVRDILRGALTGDTSKFHERVAGDTVPYLYHELICKRLLERTTQCRLWFSLGESMLELNEITEVIFCQPCHLNELPWISTLLMVRPVLRNKDEIVEQDRYLLETYAAQHDTHPLSFLLVYAAYEWGCERSQERLEVINKHKRVHQLKSPRTMHDDAVILASYETKVLPVVHPSILSPPSIPAESKTYSICDVLFRRKKKPAPVKPIQPSDVFVTTPRALPPPLDLNLWHMPKSPPVEDTPRRQTVRRAVEPRERKKQQKHGTALPTAAQIKAVSEDPDFISLLQTENSYHEL